VPEVKTERASGAVEGSGGAGQGGVGTGRADVGEGESTAQAGAEEETGELHGTEKLGGFSS